MSSISQITNPAGERLDVSFHGGDKLGALVVLGHGVTGNKDRPLIIAIAKGLAEKGWPCLRFSFAGNGDSEGRFEDSTITKEIEDLKTVLRTVPQEKRIAYIGHSMGGAVGVLTAAGSLNIHTMVTLAGMTYTRDFVTREFGDVTPGEGCMWDEEACPLSKNFVEDLNGIGDTLKACADVRQPWLLIHGKDDDVIPLKDSIDAIAAARCEKELLQIAGAGHVFGEESYSGMIESIHAWLERNLG